jgi:hypothetical protein
MIFRIGEAGYNPNAMVFSRGFQRRHGPSQWTKHHALRHELGTPTPQILRSRARTGIKRDVITSLGRTTWVRNPRTPGGIFFTDPAFFRAHSVIPDRI